MNHLPVSENKRNAADLARLAVGLEVKFDAGGKGTFSGYGAVFDNVDLGGDLITKGAFAQTLRDWKSRGKLPKMLLQHGGFFGPVDDSIPIGKWTTMEEDSKGLHVEGQLIALDTDRGKAIHAAMAEGELDGLSIGYRAKEFVLGTKPNEPRRTIKRADLLEVSVVLFGMNPEALVSSVKNISSIGQYERFLHQHGFAKAAAKKLAAGGWSALSPAAAPAPSKKSLAAAILAAAGQINSRKG